MPKKPTTTNPLEHQVGGTHYKVQGVQHTTFCQRNRIPWNESCALKYLCRHRRKNGKQDLEKAKHYLQFAALEEYLMREEAGLKELKDMEPSKFPIKVSTFLQDNDVPPAETKIIDLILHHQVRRGESSLIDAQRLIEELIKTYDTPAEEDYTSLL